MHHIYTICSLIFCAVYRQGLIKKWISWELHKITMTQQVNYTTYFIQCILQLFQSFRTDIRAMCEAKIQDQPMSKIVPICHSLSFMIHQSKRSTNCCFSNWLLSLCFFFYGIRTYFEQCFIHHYAVILLLLNQLWKVCKTDLSYKIAEKMCWLSKVCPTPKENPLP